MLIGLEKVIKQRNISIIMKKAFYIIIRGPLGCGKTTIAERLAKELDAEYFSVDKILSEFDLKSDKESGYISQKSFCKANEFIAKRTKKFLEKGRIVIVDGNFYWKSAIDDLSARLKYDHQVLTLKASLKTCITRDKGRSKSHGEEAARAVFKKSTSFKNGKVIDTEHKSIDETIRIIKKKL